FSFLQQTLRAGENRRPSVLPCLLFPVSCLLSPVSCLLSPVSCPLVVSSSPQVRIRLTFRTRDRETQTLRRQVRRGPDRLERIQRARSVLRLPAPQVAQATCFQPELDAAFPLEQAP